jgi:hypothetical protein
MKIFEPKRKEITGDWINSIMRSFMNFALHLILMGQ